MKNSVVASLEFYFKGEQFTPSVELNLDKLMESGATLQTIYSVIAMANRIDAYSYEYEMMMAEEIQFSQPEGLAVEFVQDGAFDIEAFRAKWKELRVVEAVRPIAERCVGVTDLDAKPKLKAALIEAYQAGIAEGSRDGSGSD